MSELLTVPVDNILAIYSERSADQDGIAERLDRLDEHARQVGIAKPARALTVATMEETMGLLDTHVNEGTLIDVLAGDGSLHHIADAYTRLGLQNRITNSIGGGAADTAAQLHPNKFYRKRPDTLLYSPAVEQRPLSITATYPEAYDGPRKETIQAISYFSIGFTAMMSDRFNQQDFREQLEGLSPNKRLIEQGKEILSHIDKSEQFIVRDKTENGTDRVRRLSELVFPNGSRMAHNIHFDDIDLLKHEFGQLEVDKPLSKRVFVAAAGRALLGKFVKHSPESVIEFSVLPLDSDDFLVQADGEAYRYPAETSFRVAQSSNVIPFVTTDFRYKHLRPVAA